MIWRPSALLVPMVVATCSLVVLLLHQAAAFHLSFGHRLLKSVQQHSNPQLNPASSLIRPIECRNANNHSEAGICMFSIDCMHNKGTPLSICKHNYFVGTCCRLPDYNNFVGIVYDLRDTEAHQNQVGAQLLEARGATGTQARNDSNSESGGWPPAHQQLGSPASTPDLAITPTLASVSPTPPSPAPAPPASPSANHSRQTEEKLGDKYVISASSLFPPQPTSGPPSSPMPVPAATPVRQQGGESARNADGVASTGPQPAESHRPNELVDTFQIQVAPVASAAGGEPAGGNSSTSSTRQQVALELRQANCSAYELIRDEASDPGAEVLSSAHSAPQQQPAIVLAHSSQQPPNNNVYLLHEPGQRPTTIVFASTQQQPAAPPATTLATRANLNDASVPGDQEFTLSTSVNGHLGTSSPSAAPKADHRTAPPTSPTTPTTAAGEPSERPHEWAPQTTLPAATLSPRNSSSSLSAPAPAPASSSSPSSQPTASPFVDLVSHPAGYQTTTPFTSSLSTALLPNVSSHPYSPTTPASVSPPNGQLVSSSSTSLAGASSASPPPTTKQQSSSSTSKQQPVSTSEPPAAFSQLYSNQHSSSNQNNHQHQNQVIDHPLANGHNHMSLGRPSLGLGSPALQAASKIVTGPTSNNLIPGLGGLQSAILSHIPFKIASGLSSGLSSYLQAAMKPTGSRPLLSSNTAPALQYQQHQQQQHQWQANSTSGAGGARPAGAIRFPPVSPSTVSAAPVAPTGAPSDGGQLAGASVTGLPARDGVKDAQQVCGRPQVAMADANKKRVARIVGGNQSSFGQWPWMVSLRQWRKGAFLHKCGAALLNENWAITAAHCVENVKASDLLLRLGEFDVSKQDEPFPYSERRVKTVVSHPSFDPKTFEYDLALLRFTESVQYERNIIPVCVPAGNDSYVDRMATVIGWGRLYEDGPLPDIIQHVDVPIITNNECEKMYKNAGYIEEIPDMFICAGISKGGRDSCEGDSGGPLTMVDHDGRSYLVGIISWGIGCALPSQPGVYTRITAFSGWINDIIAN